MKITPYFFTVILGLSSCTNFNNNGNTIDKKVDSLLSVMTLDEKIGQLNQYASAGQATGIATKDTTIIEQIKQGMVGSMLNVIGSNNTRIFQEYAMQSRLKIPLIFGLDVIHGLKTVFPIPLGEAASFDLDLMRRTASAAALEASSCGIHWTFAPMLDISRDARWGRVMEGAGEDTWYASEVAKARVKGFQGDNLYDKNTIMACAKHFATYGACIAGKDYNSVDMSLYTLNETYLPPFKAAIEAGVGSFMNSFNELNGVPATGNIYLLRDLLKGKWEYEGMVVSDWGSIKQMIAQGYSTDLKEAAFQAISAGCDMDMESRAYYKHLKSLVEEGKVEEILVDDAVRRILKKKFELGLFDDPFRYCNQVAEKENILSDSLHSLSLEAAEKSIVLLKNNDVLPLNNDIDMIAVVGPLSVSKNDMLGAWAFQGDRNVVSTPLDGIKAKWPNAKVIYIEGYDIKTNRITITDNELNIIKKADVTICSLGETANESGESRSKADIEVNKNQQKLLATLKDYSKKLVALVMGGRPLVLGNIDSLSDAVLYTWWLGTEAGNGIANVLSGKYNPSAKLPVTLPRHVGQCPIYYNYNNTGHPEMRNANYTTGYIDVDYSPLYSFGYGLSYSKFDFSSPVLDKKEYDIDDDINISVDVKNISDIKGKETVQLYIRDLVSSYVRPIKELKGFKQVELMPNEQKRVSFKLTKSDLGYYNSDSEYIVEPGNFLIMVGNSATNLKIEKIKVINKK